MAAALRTARLVLREWCGEDVAVFDFEHPRLPPGQPLRRHVLYRLRPPAPSR